MERSKDDPENPEWESIRRILGEFSSWFPDGLVVIGGVAVTLHAVKEDKKSLIEFSHDGDFYLSLTDYSELRDIEVITNNSRLQKKQLIKNGIDFDIYVEHQNGLTVPFAEIIRDSEVIDGIRVASLEHLLVLKLDALSDRSGTPKGDKDERDIVKILLLTGVSRTEILLEYLDSTRKSLIESLGKKAEPFRVVAEYNSHLAAELRELFRNKVMEINDALSREHENLESDNCSPSP